ncbi:arrestin domain-containing protein 5-like [Pomacea canaliculata]|uniref:arrestin domain-containing protein 5-like n=1 Tax=Pomacea canaliculata TaxID=400727 RepID=UPI000D72A1C2|nr:arrestin domain-containing protein 5-like [Pomacea canaliculata]XP_025080707.1 arrestin domain-containing protein 5-like [Pomacea canaliculata]
MFTPRDGYLIELPPDKSQAEYFPGEIIRGRVYIRWDPSFPVPVFQMQLRGEAKVVLNRYKTILCQREQILKTRQAVRNMRRPTQLPVLPSNTNVYEFEFLLPHDLPPSFTSPRGRKGRLEYCLEVMKVEPYYEHIYHAIAITVKPFQPLAGNLVAMLPALQEQQQARHYFCCGADRRIEVRALLTQVGVHAGEVIPFRAFITNHSEYSIKSSHIILRRRWMWYSIGMTTNGSERVRSFKKVSRGAIPPGGSMRWDPSDYPLVLPSDLLPSGPSGCAIMRASYELVFTVVPEGMVRNMKLRLPIIVGTDVSPQVRASMERNTAASAASVREAVMLHLPRNAVTERPAVDREVPPEQDRPGLHEISPLHL